MMRSRPSRQRARAIRAIVLLAGGLLFASTFASSVAAGAARGTDRLLAHGLARQQSLSAAGRLDGPDALAVDSGGLWIVNGAGNSVSEASPVTGRWIRTLSSKSYHFRAPVAVV